MCYGRNLATGDMIGIGEAVGIIAAQSIGEPGTQLTMRTFHTGGVAGQDITQGLPRVEELFEARIPKGKAEISHIDGIVEVIASETGRKVKVTSREAFDTPIVLPEGAELLAAAGDLVELNQVLARSATAGDVTAPVKGFLARTDDGTVVRSEDVVEREYAIPHSAKLLVEDGQEIRAGDAITDGPINPQEYLDTRGKDAVQRYLVREVQRVYRSQGVTINDKHIEIIVRQMLKKVRIDQPGDCEQLPTELIDRLDFEEANNRVLSEGGEPATAQTVLLGVTKASLNTSSFLAAASFQETTRVLTEAAINGARDHLVGLKENVIIGKLIPAGIGRAAERRRDQGAPAPGRPRGARRRGPRGPRRAGVQPVPRGRRPRRRRRDRRPRPGGDDRRSRTRTSSDVQPVPRRGPGRARRRRGCAQPVPRRRLRGGLAPPQQTRQQRPTPPARRPGVFDTRTSALLNSAFVASRGPVRHVRRNRPRRDPSGPRPDPRHAWIRRTDHHQ